MDNNTDNVNVNTGTEEREDEESTYVVVGVRFKDFGKVYYFDPAGIELENGDGVIVDTVRGNEFAYVTSMVSELPASMITLPLKKVVRKATEADMQIMRENKEKEKEYLAVCQREIDALGLPMLLVGCERSFDGGKIVIYFTADGRVDFRELVRKLYSALPARPELRQIGDRDKAKLLGDLGPCGRSICCATHLSSFEHISIKMVKDQGISLGGSKVFGMCGKLFCCLKYEQEAYEEMRSKMPPVNSEVDTPDGHGFIVENVVLAEKCKVRVTLSDGTPEIRQYPLADLVVTKLYKPQKQQKKSAPAPDTATDDTVPED